MPIVLYDLAAGDGRRFSPHCWRTRLALAHKQLSFRDNPKLFIGIPKIAQGQCTTVPVIQDGDKVLEDSWTIAEYLEETYPDQPSLFGGPAGKALTRFVQNYTVTQLHGPIARMIIKDIHDLLDPHDQDYFRESREARFGQTLEEVQMARDEVLPQFHANLMPLRRQLQSQPFVAGEAPAYADYIVFGAFQWARCCSPFRILPEDAEELHAWMERMKGLFYGMPAQQPAYW